MSKNRKFELDVVGAVLSDKLLSGWQLPVTRHWPLAEAVSPHYNSLVSAAQSYILTATQFLKHFQQGLDSEPPVVSQQIQTF